MPIPADIELTAHLWGLDPTLIAAVDIAEGGGDRLTAAVRCSVPTVQNRNHAIEITCRSCTHALSDFIKSNPLATRGMEDFITFWAKRWAPVKAGNDPNNLNPNWPTNVIQSYHALNLHPPQAVRA